MLECGTGCGTPRGRARESAEQVAGQAQEKAEEVRAQASGRMREQVDSRSTQAGEQVRSLADAMRRTGETLRNEGKEGPAKVTDGSLSARSASAAT